MNFMYLDGKLMINYNVLDNCGITIYHMDY